MSRLPIRARLTLAFALAVTLVFAGTGLFLYLRLGAELDQTLDTGLRSRAADLVALITEGSVELEKTEVPGLAASSLSLTQVLASDGGIDDATRAIRDRPLLTPAQAAQAHAGPIVFDRKSPLPTGEPIRVVAAPATEEGRTRIAVVAASLTPRAEALSGLAALLLLGGPVAVALISLAGYLLAGAALRPVEAMRTRAEQISAGPGEELLPVPPARDEISRLGETLNRMLERLRAALARERRFVADASHELRTPLSILKGEVDLALEQRPDREALLTTLSSVGEETERLVRLAEDLLVVARSDDHGLPLRIEVVDVLVLGERLRSRFEARARAAERDLIFDAGGVGDISADVLRIEQALVNLLDNALRYGAGEVTLTFETALGGVRIAVADRGPGFPEALLDHAFERFTRGDDARGHGGSGLGLAIVRTIVEAHGGSARAENTATGAIVSLWIPQQPKPQ